MLLLDLALGSPPADVALDEALLSWAAARTPGEDREILRLWESPQYAVVIGRASKTGDEVYLDRCQNDNVPVLRRCSGGASVVIGPGCLMYAVILDLHQSPHLESINVAHKHVTGKLASALRSAGQPVDVRGHCDLTINNWKFSGNALRITRTHVLYHGTVLHDFDLELVGHYLREPPRQPDYRSSRTHGAFIRNIDVQPETLRKCLIDEWSADQPLIDWPRETTKQLVEEKYSRDEWNLKR
jgi:lipoate---protein ligase